MKEGRKEAWIRAVECLHLDSHEYLVEIEGIGNQHPTSDSNKVRTEFLSVAVVGCVGLVVYGYICKFE